jgi:hypothetical protein
VDALRAVYEQWQKPSFCAGVDLYDPLVLFVPLSRTPAAGHYLGKEGIKAVYCAAWRTSRKSTTSRIMDRYQLRTDPSSGITNDPNAYSDDPRYVVDLLMRVITVSLNTLAVTDQLRNLESGSAGQVHVSM